MTTRAEAFDVVYPFIGKRIERNIDPFTTTVTITHAVIDALIEYGLHPNAIKVAFTEKVAPKDEKES